MPDDMDTIGKEPSIVVRSRETGEGSFIDFFGLSKFKSTHFKIVIRKVQYIEWILYFYLTNYLNLYFKCEN
jgi:hypothetical protein